MSMNFMMDLDFSWLSWVIPTAISTLLAVLYAISKGAFRKGRVEASTEGRVDLNSNMITNAIQQIEALKREVQCIRNEMHQQNINSARLEERIKYLTERLDALVAEVRGMRQDSNDRNDEIDRRWSENDRRSYR